MTDNVKDDAPGWDAITDAMTNLYGEVEPHHYGTIIPAMLGGDDPLQGISIYKSTSAMPHWHFVTYGFSELYDKESDDAEFSGYGFELTFRLLRGDEEEAPQWALSFLQNLARYVFSSGNYFDTGHHMNANGPIALEEDTLLHAIAFVDDPELSTLDTPNGKVGMLQVCGITLDELDAAQAWNTAGLMSLLEPKTPLFITDLNRNSVLDDPMMQERVEAGIKADGSSMGSQFISKCDWRIHKKLLRSDQLVITLGANGLKHLGRALIGRLTFGRDLLLSSDDSKILLEQGDVFSWHEEQLDGIVLLKLVLPDTLTREIAETLKPVAGEYAFADNRLLFVIEQSIIKNQDGSTREVIG